MLKFTKFLQLQNVPLSQQYLTEQRFPQLLNVYPLDDDKINKD